MPQSLSVIQSLDVISVNLWQVLISLANLILLFLILKKFLYKPVKETLAKRQSELDEKYSSAKKADEQAQQSKELWEEKLKSAAEESAAMLSSAAENARYREEKIISEAKEQADGIIRRAKAEADLEMKKAADGIKREIVEVSGALTEKMIGREINEEDHRNLIDSFIEKIGDEDVGSK